MMVDVVDTYIYIYIYIQLKLAARTSLLSRYRVSVETCPRVRHSPQGELVREKFFCDMFFTILVAIFKTFINQEVNNDLV